MYQPSRAPILTGMSSSIWGKRVDSWFDQKTGAGKAERSDYQRLGGDLIGVLIVAVVFVVVVLVLHSVT